MQEVALCSYKYFCDFIHFISQRPYFCWRYDSATLRRTSSWASYSLLRVEQKAYTIVAPRCSWENKRSSLESEATLCDLPFHLHLRSLNHALAKTAFRELRAVKYRSWNVRRVQLSPHCKVKSGTVKKKGPKCEFTTFRKRKRESTREQFAVFLSIPFTSNFDFRAFEFSQTPSANAWPSETC